MLKTFKSDLRLLSQYTQLFPLCFAVFVSMLGFGLVMPLLPIYARDFGATGGQLGLLTASFAITRAVVTFPGGWLADKAGRKIPVITGLFAYSAVMTLYGFSQEVNQLILLRGLQGLASGIVWPVISTMVTDITAPKDRSKALGLYEMMWFLGIVVGPGIGGVLAGAFTIAIPFFVCGALAFLSTVLVAFTVKETATDEDEEPQMEEPALYAPENEPFLSSPVTRLTPYPRMFLGLCTVGFIISFSNSLIQPVLSVFANEELGVSVTDVGFLFVAMGIATLITTLPMGTVADRVDRKTTLSLGMALRAVSAVSIIVSGGFWPLLLVMMLRGFGRSATNPSLLAMFSNLVPTSTRGKSMGVFNGFRNIGLVAGSTIGGFLYEATSFQSPFITCAVAGLIGVIIVLLAVSEPDKGLG